MTRIGAGDQAPDFEARDQHGQRIRLRDLKGRAVVLYFYPADDTPGCTIEACSFRDEGEAFRARGAIVLGVSTQDGESHRRFAAKHGLTFSLLADPDKAIARAYGALGLLGYAKRVTFLIGPDGRVARVFGSVSPGAHAAEVVAAIDGLARARA